MDKISVIVPVYNVESYLPHCLNSILMQTYQNLEIILIDDGSEDKTGEICEEYSAKDNRIIVVHKENGGVSAARNAGLDIASGDYISFVDGDDWLEPNMYEVLHRNAVEYDTEISCCGISQHRLDGSVNSLADNSVYLYTQQELIAGFFSLPDIKETMYGPYNKIFKACLLENIRFDKRFAIGEDLLFVFECIEHARNVVVDNQPLYHYIKREGSATTSSFSPTKLHYIYVADLLCEKCKLKYPYAYSEAVAWAYLHKLVVLRNMNKYPEIRRDYKAFYEECKKFIRTNKDAVWKKLSAKRKVDYCLLRVIPWIYRIVL